MNSVLLEYLLGLLLHHEFLKKSEGCGEQAYRLRERLYNLWDHLTDDERELQYKVQEELYEELIRE